jgi:hemoglobin
VTDAVSFYEEVGGQATFARLVDLFYEGVAADPVLRAMYPEEDLGPARHRMTTFLAQYWGGPRTYGEQRGHPRLRLRHSGFAIDDKARGRWLRHMRSALDQLDITDTQREVLWSYLDRSALTMVNR